MVRTFRVIDVDNNSHILVIRPPRIWDLYGVDLSSRDKQLESMVKLTAKLTGKKVKFLENLQIASLYKLFTVVGEIMDDTMKPNKLGLVK